MKTRRHDASGTPGLPPAPAPPSRDANPWPMSAQSEAPPKLHPRVSEAVRKSQDPRAPEAPRPAGASTAGGKFAWLPYLILVFIAVTSLRVAIEAFESGNAEAAIGPLIAIVFAVFVVWRRMRRRR